MLKELSLAALKRDLPKMGLRAGDIGTVVFIHNSGEAYEIEFLTANGKFKGVFTVLAVDLEAAPEPATP
ncbi:MAG: DUF4926 domain-containing protein [Anaerolineaceae bacterium]|nr:DUF4926 domain-containing protein [Anaerolineaceae bacterium]